MFKVSENSDDSIFVTSRVKFEVEDIVLVTCGCKGGVVIITISILDFILYPPKAIIDSDKLCYLKILRWVFP